LEHKANPDALWPHWDADVTALHLAAAHGHVEVVPLLLDAGADPRIRDSKHDGDAFGWAEFFQKPEIVQLLRAGIRRREVSTRMRLSAWAFHLLTMSRRSRRTTPFGFRDYLMTPSARS
jgi:Ankyrin repeats (many copies)